MISYALRIGGNRGLKARGKVNKSDRARKIKNHNKKRQTNAVDKAIGGRISARRLELHLSQADLGRELGITFQQIQKYEKGAFLQPAGCYDWLEKPPSSGSLLRIHPGNALERCYSACGNAAAPSN